MRTRTYTAASSSCKQLRCRGAWQRMSLALLLLMFTTMTAWAADVSLQQDGSEWYVNMPASGTDMLTLTDASVTTFKVYDYGGKNGDYSSNYTGYLVLSAPAGYIFQLSGNIMTETNWDKLTVYNGVYDGTDNNIPKLLDGVSSTNKGVTTAIGPVISSGNNMTIYFHSDGSTNCAGLDLTVTVVDPNAAYVINGLGTVMGGSIAASVGGANATTAKMNDVVTLTATPDTDNDYIFNGFSVTYANTNAVAVTWDGWFDNTATFTMPGSAVTVTPTFTKDPGNLSINMPKTSSKSITIPLGVHSFNVYDDGGKDDDYSINCDGTLVLTAPDGYILQISGSIKTETSYWGTELTVYNGSKDSGTTMLDKVSSPTAGETLAIGPLSSTGNVMTIYFKSGTYTKAGLDLIVTVVAPNASNAINGLGTVTGGSIAASVSGVSATTAKLNDEVTLTATPESGYIFSGISVKDADQNAVAVTWDGPFDNTATFTMPGSAVSVTPTFTNVLTNLYVNMPKTGEKDLTIPSGVESFKVYDDGGKDVDYSQNCTGTLVLTAPTGYVLQLSGSITTQISYWEDKLTVYDGADNTATTLINGVSSPTNGETLIIDPVISTSNVMTIYFQTGASYHSAGLDLTVTLVNTSTGYAIYGLGSVTGGSIAASVDGESATTAKVNETVTLTATPESGYLPSGFSVTDANDNVVAVTWNGSFYNTATFTMPGSAVTVTPTFTNDLTADNDLYVNMPKTLSETITIPSGVKSFKVYDDGGNGGSSNNNAVGNYSNDYKGTLVLTAPIGYVLQLSGSIMAEGSDKLTVYDGANNTAAKLIDEVGGSGSSKKDITTVTSTGNVLRIYFDSDGSMNYAGLDLTVTLVSVLNENWGITDAASLKGRMAQFSRTFSAGVASTLCLPFPMTTIPGGKAYEFGDVTYDATANNGAGAWVATYNEATVTEANKPYLYKADTNAKIIFCGTVASDFDGTPGTSTADHAGGGTWTFHGAYTTLIYGSELSGYVYGFAGAASDNGISAGDFVQLGGTSYVPPFRCYLTYSKGELTAAYASLRTSMEVPDKIIVRLVDKNGTPTSIGTMDTRTSEVVFGNEWNSLDGRLIEGQPMQKGVYINNGKKVMIK